MKGWLDGKVVFVTGAGMGIGKAIALACAQAGASVCATDLDDEKLLMTVAQIAEEGGKEAIAVAADISIQSDVARIIEAVDDKWGRLDGAVANAGIGGPRNHIQDYVLDDWNKVIGVNLTGTFMTVSAAAHYMVAQGQGGSILATGSSSALRAIPGSAAYVASKGAVHAMMNVLALELAPHKIRANVLLPGPTRTPSMEARPEHMKLAAASVPLQELADPAEIAKLAVFAMSDVAPHMTGTQLKVDCGRTIG